MFELEFLKLFNYPESVLSDKQVKSWIENAGIGVVEYQDILEGETELQADKRKSCDDIYNGDYAELFSVLRETFPSSMSDEERLLYIYNMINPIRKILRGVEVVKEQKSVNDIPSVQSKSEVVDEFPQTEDTAETRETLKDDKNIGEDKNMEEKDMPDFTQKQGTNPTGKEIMKQLNGITQDTKNEGSTAVFANQAAFKASFQKIANEDGGKLIQEQLAKVAANPIERLYIKGISKANRVTDEYYNGGMGQYPLFVGSRTVGSGETQRVISEQAQIKKKYDDFLKATGAVEITPDFLSDNTIDYASYILKFNAMRKIVDGVSSEADDLEFAKSRYPRIAEIVSKSLVGRITEDFFERRNTATKAKNKLRGDKKPLKIFNQDDLQALVVGPTGWLMQALRIEEALCKALANPMETFEVMKVSTSEPVIGVSISNNIYTKETLKDFMIAQSIYELGVAGAFDDELHIANPKDKPLVVSLKFVAPAGKKDPTATNTPVIQFQNASAKIEGTSDYKWARTYAYAPSRNPDDFINGTIAISLIAKVKDSQKVKTSARFYYYDEAFYNAKNKNTNQPNKKLKIFTLKSNGFQYAPLSVVDDAQFAEVAAAGADTFKPELTAGERAKLREASAAATRATRAANVDPEKEAQAKAAATKRTAENIAMVKAWSIQLDSNKEREAAKKQGESQGDADKKDE